MVCPWSIIIILWFIAIAKSRQKMTNYVRRDTYVLRAIPRSQISIISNNDLLDDPHKKFFGNPFTVPLQNTLYNKRKVFPNNDMAKWMKYDKPTNNIILDTFRRFSYHRAIETCEILPRLIRYSLNHDSISHEWNF